MLGVCVAKFLACQVGLFWVPRNAWEIFRHCKSLIRQAVVMMYVRVHHTQQLASAGCGDAALF